VQIRPARAEDAPDLARLRWELRTSELETHYEVEADFVSRCAAWMADRLRNPGGWSAWLAESPTAIVGAIWLHSVEKIPNPNDEPERFAYISNLYVRPRYRGGVGARLLRACLEAAPADAVEQVLLWPTDRSRTLYGRFGFDTTRDLLVRAQTTPTGRGRTTVARDAAPPRPHASTRPARRTT
jgi:ribosomal protein S18 acetylase RimI-like enzyme